MRDAESLLSKLDQLGPTDREILGRAKSYDGLWAGAWPKPFGREDAGVTHDYTLDVRPWNVPFDQIQVPIQIWHGEDDRLLSPQASRILADALPHAARGATRSSCKPSIRRFRRVAKANGSSDEDQDDGDDHQADHERYSD